MAAREDELGQSYDLSELLKKVRARTPARLLVGRTGAAYRPSTQMELREVIRHCRVGIINEIGDLLDPKVVVLLIGERPGLATAESLSSYMEYQPNASHTDANRNLISNIHARGVNPERAAKRILDLAASMLKTQKSGFQLREDLPALHGHFYEEGTTNAN